jgi:uncharacterized protein YheU (UPF0270 family)
MSAERRPGHVKASVSGKYNLLRMVLLGATALTGFGAGAVAAQPVLYGGRVQEARLGGDSGARYGDRYEDRRFSRDALRRYHDRVEWALSRGALSRSEADRLHFRANALDDLARAMARRDGLDYYERDELDNRFADLRAQFRRLVWDRDYRGAYSEEWRSTRDKEQRYWEDDDRSGMASRDDYAARGANRAAPDLKSSDGDDDWQPPELGTAPPASGVVIPPPQPYRSDQPVPPATRKPSPSQRAAPAPSNDDQPFKDGRDFH